MCFSRDIREQIMIDNPKDRKYFTKEQCELVSGEPYKPSDQDTYKQLMTMEDKEIRFWIKYDMVPPFLEEARMGTWEDIVKDYNERMEREKELGIDVEKQALEEALGKLSITEIEEFMDEGEVPQSILDICVLDPKTFKLMSKNYPDIEIGSLSMIVDAYENGLEAKDLVPAYKKGLYYALITDIISTDDIIQINPTRNAPIRKPKNRDFVSSSI